MTTGVIHAMGCRHTQVEWSTSPLQRSAFNNHARVRILVDIADAFPNLAVIRGSADSNSFRLRFNEARLHETMRPKNMQPGQMFDGLEQARCDALGGQLYPGALGNIASYLSFYKCVLDNRLRAFRLDEATAIARSALMLEAAFLMVQHAPFDEGMQHNIAAWMDRSNSCLALSDFTRLNARVTDQASYAAESLALLQRMGHAIKPEAKQSMAGFG